MAQRDTARKKIIRRVFHERFGGGPVLLSELRWRVLEARAEENGEPLESITRSERESFNRTIRVMGDELTRYQIGPVNGIPFGVAAREACMRLERPGVIASLIESEDVIAALRWVGTVASNGAVQSPEFSFWTGDSSDGSSLKCHALVRLNNGRPVTFVCAHMPSKRMVREMGIAVWRPAIVINWPGHLVRHFENVMATSAPEPGLREWIRHHPFGSSDLKKSLNVLPPEILIAPLNGPHRHGPQGVSYWGTLYKLRKAGAR